MKILLVGATGQLGSSILSLSSKHEIFAPGKGSLDIENLKSCRNVMMQFRPDVVINTAAFHNVPLCEETPHRAFCVNAVAVGNLAKLCKEFDAFFVTFSSDYVFDGIKQAPYNEDDQARPLQVYGASKLAGEHLALNNAPDNTIIVRTCGLYGMCGATSKGGNFVDKRVQEACGLEQLMMGIDQTVSPTSAHDLAKAVIALLEHRQITSGVFHMVNEGACTWYEFTQEIYKLLNINVKLVAVDRKGYDGAMRRPLYSALSNNNAKLLGIQLPSWKVGLANYINEKYN